MKEQLSLHLENFSRAIIISDTPIIKQHYIIDSRFLQKERLSSNPKGNKTQLKSRYKFKKFEITLAKLMKKYVNRVNPIFAPSLTSPLALILAYVIHEAMITTLEGRELDLCDVNAKVLAG